MYQLGGHAHFLSPQDIYTPALPEDMVAYQTEAISDVARVLSRYGDAIAIRIYGDAAKWIIGRGHKVVQEFAKHATVPVLNMEDDMYHPFQALADAQAMRQAIPKLKGKKLVVSYAYSGGLKPLAVPQSEVLIGTQLGMDVILAHPPGFELEDVVTQACKANADRYGGGFRRERYEGGLPRGRRCLPQSLVSKAIRPTPQRLSRQEWRNDLPGQVQGLDMHPRNDGPHEQGQVHALRTSRPGTRSHRRRNRQHGLFTVLRRSREPTTCSESRYGNGDGRAPVEAAKMNKV